MLSWCKSGRGNNPRNLIEVGLISHGPWNPEVGPRFYCAKECNFPNQWSAK